MEMWMIERLIKGLKNIKRFRSLWSQVTNMVSRIIYYNLKPFKPTKCLQNTLVSRHGPFHLISPPPIDEVSKILTPKKKNPSANTKHPSEMRKCSHYPSEKSQRSNDDDRLNPSEMTLELPFRKTRP